MKIGFHGIMDIEEMEIFQKTIELLYSQFMVQEVVQNSGVQITEVDAHSTLTQSQQQQPQEQLQPNDLTHGRYILKSQKEDELTQTTLHAIQKNHVTTLQLQRPQLQLQSQIIIITTITTCQRLATRKLLTTNTSCPTFH